jgi:hypothetical protein
LAICKARESPTYPSPITAACISHLPITCTKVTPSTAPSKEPAVLFGPRTNTGHPVTPATDNSAIIAVDTGAFFNLSWMLMEPIAKQKKSAYTYYYYVLSSIRVKPK